MIDNDISFVYPEIKSYFATTPTETIKQTEVSHDSINKLYDLMMSNPWTTVVIIFVIMFIIQMIFPRVFEPRKNRN